jgi:ArsR family transcriptional regulator, arsenate/arsenite/antimonite-responsive transcriptional repressor
MFLYYRYVEHNQSVDILKALADETRLSIVRRIAQDTLPTPSCELPRACSQQLSQPTMSHHISKLVEAGVLKEEKRSTKKVYTLQKEALERIGIDVTKL